MSAATLEETARTTAPTDGSIRTHIVNCPEDKSSTESWLTEARVMGLEVTALCGHKWVPQSDPKKFPVCEACLDAAQIIIAEEGL